VERGGAEEQQDGMGHGGTEEKQSDGRCGTEEQDEDGRTAGKDPNARLVHVLVVACIDLADVKSLASSSLSFPFLC
jgi:hypothetical protein